MSRRNEKLYHIYYGMKARCYNKNNPKYNIYGGKGIKICNEWLYDYDIFKKWAINNGYKENKKLSIDRIDSNKNYCPNNCQWITISENSAKANFGRQKNKSKNKDMYAISPNGKEIKIYNISKFAREYGLNRASVSHRLNGITKTPYLCGWKIYNKKEQ